MPFQGLPGEDEVNRLCHQKRFRDTYGEGSDPKALYVAQPVWTRFAPIFQRVTYLLDNLNWIYSVLDVTLVQFRNAYVLHGDVGPEGYRLVAPHIKNVDPFEYFSGYVNEDEQRSCLLHLRWALQRNRGSHSEFLFRECANDILDSAKSDDRKMIVDELMSAETASSLSSIPIDMDKGIWAVRRQVAWREGMINDALKRVREVLDVPHIHPASQHYYGPQSLPSPTTNGFHDVEYGADPIMGNGDREPNKKELRFSEQSPPRRSVSPTWSRRGRHDAHRQRSISRDSYASTMHSITTEVPEEPDHFSLSMKVFSHATDEWHDINAVMDTGCNAGNWISSSYLEEQLQMGAHIEKDDEADVIEVIDFSGKTDMKPRGKVKLLWYGKMIEQGRQAKRSVESEDWFWVAPHLPMDSGKPFDILLGTDWILKHQVFKFRGLRLFKSKDKRGKTLSAQEKAILRQRELLREEAEMERLNERFASDAASISTGHSGSSPMSAGPPSLTPRDSSQSIASSVASSFDQANGHGGVVDAHAVA